MIIQNVFTFLKVLMRHDVRAISVRMFWTIFEMIQNIWKEGKAIGFWKMVFIQP